MEEIVIRTAVAGVARFGILALIVIWYLAATLPYLADFPTSGWAQMGIAAPAYKLASQGVYGNDLYTGFYRTEELNYEYMPAYPLLVAASFKVLGLGIWQARLVGVVCGLITILLTCQLGRRVCDHSVGLVAAGVLCALRLELHPDGTGVPLLDFARVIRYDILVPVFVLAACISFLSAVESGGRRRRAWSLFLAGGLAGMATLSHLYGAFILPVLLAVLLWQERRRALRLPSTYLLPLGWVVGVLPWIVYVSRDPTAFAGQMSRHEGRFDVFDPGFYWHNLMTEYGRYGVWTGRFPEDLLTPRLGLWVLVIGVMAGLVLLWRRARSEGHAGDRLLLVATPVLALQLALLMNLKRYPYLVLLLPFLALTLAFSVVTAWRRARQHSLRVARVALLVVAVAATVEAGWGIVRMLDRARRTTPYRDVTDAIAASLPVGSRLLITAPYWLGLARYETRTTDLLFVRPLLPVDEKMRVIDPDYVVVDRSFFSPSYTSHPGVVARWQAFGRYLAMNCVLTATVDDASYGTIDIHRCRARAQPDAGAG